MRKKGNMWATAMQTTKGPWRAFSLAQLPTEFESLSDKMLLNTCWPTESKPICINKRQAEDELAAYLSLGLWTFHQSRHAIQYINSS